VYSIIIAVAAGLLTGFFTGRDLGTAWGIVCGVAAFLLVQLIIILVLRRKLNKVQVGMQQTMLAAQARIQRQIQMFQQRPVGSPKLMQQKLETMQNDALHETLRQTAAFEPYRHWNWMLSRQVNTMKMQLYFQLKDFETTDKLLPKCLLMDVRSLVIKLVRMYKTGDLKLDKFYRKKCRRFKAEDGAFLACVYAWIKLKQDDQAKAVAALVAAKTNSDNATLLANYEHLANNRPKHFSNAAFGDTWYALYLEEPKVRPQKVQQRMY